MVIAEYGTIFLILAVVFGLYMTWGIGANDVANAMGTSVGSGAITVKQAIIIAAIFEFLGAFLAGGNVTKTIRNGIIDPSPIFDKPEILVLGLLSALLAAGIWLMVASYFGWPVSTTHTIVGAQVGFAAVGIGMDAVYWSAVGEIVLSWIISPILGGAIAYFLMKSIQKSILDTDTPFINAKRYSPFYVFIVGFIMSLLTLFKGLKHLNLDLTNVQSIIASILIGTVTALIGRILINKITVNDEKGLTEEYKGIEKIFSIMMVFTACAMAFAHGSNDVANGIGPMAAVISIVESGKVLQSSALPLWILTLGGIGIVIGLATLGYKVMQTIGKKITELVPTRGFAAVLAAAAAVAIFSKMGIPVSTTHIAVGSVMGVGLARGIGALNLQVIGGIFMSWIITLPVGGGLAIFFYFFFKGIFLF